LEKPLCERLIRSQNGRYTKPVPHSATSFDTNVLCHVA
jgi:hypothetical protein